MGKTKKRRDLTAKEKAAQQNLLRIWNSKKDELGLTQEVAADAMGYKTQGAVNQYLNGKIPLNTDATLKFALLLQVKPNEIDKEFGQFENTRPAVNLKADRIDIHQDIEKLPAKLLNKARLALEVVKKTES